MTINESEDAKPQIQETGVVPSKAEKPKIQESGVDPSKDEIPQIQETGVDPSPHIKEVWFPGTHSDM